jgi:hypothetical protein
MTYLRVRSVPCPYCPAVAGEPCRNGRGEQVRYTHAARDRRSASMRETRKRKSSYPAHPSRPLTVPCPVCPAAVGQECVHGPERPGMRFHRDRYTAAVDTFLRQAREKRLADLRSPPARNRCPGCGMRLDRRGVA